MLLAICEDAHPSTSTCLNRTVRAVCTKSVVTACPPRQSILYRESLCRQESSRQETAERTAEHTEQGPQPGGPEHAKQQKISGKNDSDASPLAVKCTGSNTWSQIDSQFDSRGDEGSRKCRHWHSATGLSVVITKRSGLHDHAGTGTRFAWPCPHQGTISQRMGSEGHMPKVGVCHSVRYACMHSQACIPCHCADAGTTLKSFQDCRVPPRFPGSRTYCNVDCRIHPKAQQIKQWYAGQLHNRKKQVWRVQSMCERKGKRSCAA
jgi:hypothetical protein